MSNNSRTQSLWSAASGMAPEFQPLTGDIKTDVAIIGGGITGISAAYNLIRKGKKVVLLEAGKIGLGTTGSSTGNLYIPTGQFNSILKKHGEEALMNVIQSRAAALSFIEERINEFDIDCGFRRVPWNYFSVKKSDSKEIKKEFDAIKAGGIEVFDSPADPYPFHVNTIARVEMQAQFNPLQYVRQLASEISGDNCLICEHTKVIKINDYDPCYVETNRGTVKADKVIQATHTPKGIYMVHAQMEVYREFAVAAKLKEAFPFDGIHWALDDKNKYSIRTYDFNGDKYLLVLDDSRKVAHKEHTEESFRKLKEYVKTYFRVDDIEYKWAAQNYSPADYLPYIGTSPMESNIYIATGFSADGLIYGTVAGMILSDLITETGNSWAKTFDPKRFNPGASAAKTIKENIDVTVHLVKDYFFSGTEKELADLLPGEGKVVELRDDKAAVYRDDEGHMHVLSAKCTHMGCIVHWNSAEKSWDCPCHGTRFSTEGKVIEGPAFDSLTRYKISGG